MLAHLKELYRYRDLLFSLAVRDIKVRYRQTLLGVAWAVLQPLAFMAIFTLIFARFGRLESEGVPYPLFSYTALVPWTFFATALALAVNSIAGNMKLVKKIYFPREVFPLGAVAGCLLDFAVGGSLVAILMAIYRVAPSWQLVWVPWLLAIELALLVGASLFLSAVNVFFRDIKFIVPLTIQLWMFVTPIIYSTSMVPHELRSWYMLNPMAVVIDGMRKAILHGQPPEWPSLLLATGLVGALCIVSYGFFKRVELRFADRI